MGVEGVSQFGENPVSGFVVLCGQHLNAEFADFIFSRHEVVTLEIPLPMMPILKWSLHTVNAVEPCRTHRPCERNQQRSAVVRSLRHRIEKPEEVIHPRHLQRIVNPVADPDQEETATVFLPRNVGAD